MCWKKFALVFALGVACCPPPAGRAAEDNLAARVRAVFSAKCGHCHGPRAPRVRGGFGYVLDLRRLAADPDKVVPGKPDESQLWAMVRDGEMPLPNSPTGPLSAAQKETIRAWIAAGAPSGDSATPDKTVEPASPTEDGGADEPPAPSPGWRTLLWLGMFHLLLLHFPIALLVAAALGELWALVRRTRQPSPSVRFCLGLAAAFAVPVVVCGWLFALGGHGAGSPGVLAQHRWLGTATGACAVLTALFSERDARRGVRTWPVRVLLAVAVVLVAVTADLGGTMAYGKDFLAW